MNSAGMGTGTETDVTNGSVVSRFTSTRTTMYGIYTNEVCANDRCTLERESCTSLAGTACDDATAHRRRDTGS